MADKCFEVQSRLDDYRRGAVPSDEVSEIEAHLAVCPLCHGICEELESLATTLRAAPPPAMPPAAHLSRLNKAVAARTSSKRALGRLLGSLRERLRDWWHHPLSERAVTWAGAAALLCLGLWLGSHLRGLASATDLIRQSSLVSLSTRDGGDTGEIGRLSGGVGRTHRLSSDDALSPVRAGNSERRASR